jgi:UDP-glucose 4-epimerase
LSGKTILVTGGAGFIGSHLVDRLLSLGHKVVVVDDLSTGTLGNLNRAATFYHTSITQPGLEEVFERERPDIVNHHAAQVSVIQSIRDPLKDAEVNIQGTLHLLSLSLRYGVRRFMFSSSGGSVYGDPRYIPCREDHPVNPLSPYALSKLVAEEYLQLYQRLHGLNHVILRYANVYGPRQDPQGEAGVVAIFIKAMLEGKQPTIFGSGEQERDFTFVDEVVDANVLALEEGTGAYNIGTAQGTSVNTIFELLRGITKYRGSPLKAPARAGEVFKISLDASRARKELGWAPAVTLEEGLERTVEHFRAGLGSPAHDGSTR